MVAARHGRTQRPVDAGGRRRAAAPERLVSGSSAAQAIRQPHDLIGELGLALAGAGDDLRRARCEMNAAFASRPRAASSMASAWASSRSRRARSSASTSADACAATDDRLDLAGDHRQAAVARRGVQRLGRQVAGQRPRPDEPLDGGPERLERRARARPAGRHRRAAASAGSIFASARAFRTARMARAIASTSALDGFVAVAGGGPAGLDEQLGIARRDAAGAAQIASVTNGMTGWSSRRYVSSTSTSAHQVASRSAASSDVVGEADLGELEAPVAVLAPDRVVQDPRGLAEGVAANAASTAAIVAEARERSQRSAGPRRAGSGTWRALAAGIDAGRAPRTKRAAFQSLLAKLRAFSSLSGASRRSLPGAAPLIRAKRRRVGAEVVDRRRADRPRCPWSSTSSGRTGRAPGRER